MNFDSILSVTGAPGVLAAIAWLWLTVNKLTKDVESLKADIAHQRVYSAQTREMVEGYQPPRTTPPRPA